MLMLPLAAAVQVVAAAVIAARVVAHPTVQVPGPVVPVRPTALATANSFTDGKTP